MQKERNKTNLLKIMLVSFALILVASIIGITFAWFTDKKNYNGELSFGSVELDVSGGVDNTQKTLKFDVTRPIGSYTTGGNIMPGDTVKINFNVGLKSTSEPAYYLAFLHDTSGSFEDACYYSDGTTIHTLDGTTKIVGAVTSTTPHSFTIPATISEDFTGQGQITTVKLNIYAIQQANLSKEEAYDKLFENHYTNEGVQLNSVASFKTQLGGEDAFKTYTKIGFYKTDNFDSTGYTLDSTLTTTANNNLKAIDNGKNLIQIYKNSTDIAMVSDKKILAPKDCTNLFNKANVAKTIDLTNLDTSRTLKLQAMFNMVVGGTPKTELTNIIGLESLDTSNVTTIQGMFQACIKLQSLSGIENWNTSNVENMGVLFNACYALRTLDLSTWNTSKVTNMKQMFTNCRELTTLNLSNFNTSNVTNMVGMFAQCYKLTSLDVSNFNTSKATTFDRMFYKCNQLASLNITNFDTSSVTNMQYMFYGLGLKSSASEVNIIGLSNWNTENVTDMNEMFGNGENQTGSGKLTNSTLAGISNWDVSNVKDMTCMFYGQGTNLTTLDLSKWKPSKCESFNHMFADCKKLTTMIMTNWDTQSLLTCYNMFNDCAALTSVGDISHWNTANLYDAGAMFTRCASLTGKMDLSGWNTTNLRGLEDTFIGCTGLTEIDLSGWDISKVVGNITDAIVLAEWPNAGTKIGGSIYYEYSGKDHNALWRLFQDCTSLTKIYVGAGWDTTKHDSTTFTNCGVSEVTVK